MCSSAVPIRHSFVNNTHANMDFQMPQNNCQTHPNHCQSLQQDEMLPKTAEENLPRVKRKYTKRKKIGAVINSTENEESTTPATTIDKVKRKYTKKKKIGAEISLTDNEGSTTAMTTIERVKRKYTKRKKIGAEISLTDNEGSTTAMTTIERVKRKYTKRKKIGAVISSIENEGSTTATTSIERVKRKYTKRKKIGAEISSTDNEGSSAAMTTIERVKRKYTKRKKIGEVKSSTENKKSTVATTTIEKVPSLKYKCPVIGCTMSYNLAATLQQHYRSHGSDLKPFKCGLPSCGKLYTRQADLYHHICSGDHDPMAPGLQQRQSWSKEEAKQYVIVLSDVLDREYQALGIKKYCKGDVYGCNSGGGVGKNIEKVDEKPSGGFEEAFDVAVGNGSTAQPPIMPYFTTIRQTATGLFQCPFFKCTHQAKDRFTLKQHYRVHCGRMYRPYLCAFNKSTCRYASNQKSAVEMHIRVAHFGLPAAKGRKKKKKTTVQRRGGGDGGRENANGSMQNSCSGSDTLPTPMGIIFLNAVGNETEERVEETLALASCSGGGGGGGVDEQKPATLEVDVGCYVETVIEWLKMEDELFERANIITDLPPGGKVEKPRPYVCPNASAGCTYTATSKTNLSRHLQSMHKPPPEVVHLE